MEDPGRGEVEDEGFVVKGVALTSDCSTVHFVQHARVWVYLQGSKHLEERKTALTREAANKAKEVDQRDAASIPLMVPPSYEEVELHELTHVPYAPWCSSCIMARGCQDKREFDDSRKKDREILTISMDYCFTGYQEDEASGEVANWYV